LTERQVKFPAVWSHAGAVAVFVPSTVSKDVLLTTFSAKSCPFTPLPVNFSTQISHSTGGSDAKQTRICFIYLPNIADKDLDSLNAF